MEPAAPPTPDETADDTPSLEAIYTSHDGRPDELTLVPANTDERTRATRWLSADEETVLDLAAWR